jgi:acyl carrier protein
MPAEADSLEQVEAIRALEDEFETRFPDVLVGRPVETTFQELVQYASEQRARSGQP